MVIMDLFARTWTEISKLVM